MCQGSGKLNQLCLFMWMAMVCLLAGCGWNGIGIPAPRVSHYRNDTMRAVAIRAGGLHLFTYADGVKLTLGTCEHVLYLRAGKENEAVVVATDSADGSATDRRARLEMLPATAANEHVQPLVPEEREHGPSADDRRWLWVPPLLAGQRFAGLGLELTRGQAAVRLGMSQQLRLVMPQDGSHVLLLMNAGFDPAQSRTFYGELP